MGSASGERILRSSLERRRLRLMAVISGVSVLRIEVRAICKGPSKLDKVTYKLQALFPEYGGGSADVMACC